MRTAQARLYLQSDTGSGPTASLASLHIPILVELAEAQAKLDSISCAGGASHATVTLDALPSVGSIAIADIDTKTLGDLTKAPVENRATIIRTLLVNVDAKAHIALGGATWQTATFSAADISSGQVRTVSTNDIFKGVATSLLKNADFQATTPLGINLNLSVATQLVGSLLTPLSPALDGLVDQVTGLLGVHVGQADLRVDGVRCGKPTLVG